MPQSPPCLSAFLLALAAVAACEFPRPGDVPDDAGAGSDARIADAFSVPDGFTCTTGAFVACDGDSALLCNASGDGISATSCGAAGCNAAAQRCNQCVPGGSACGAAGIDHCGPDGLLQGHDTCPLACVAEPAAHCAYLEPKYLPNVCDAVAALPDFNVASSQTFATGVDASCNGGVVTQVGGPSICVVRYSTIRIEVAGALTVTGPRALALVGDGEVAIAGSWTSAPTERSTVRAAVRSRRAAATGRPGPGARGSRPPAAREAARPWTAAVAPAAHWWPIRRSAMCCSAGHGYRPPPARSRSRSAAVVVAPQR